MSEQSPILSNKTVAKPREKSATNGAATALAVLALIIAMAAAAVAGYAWYRMLPQLAAVELQQQTLGNQQQAQRDVFQSKQAELQRDLQQQLLNTAADWSNKQQVQQDKMQLELTKLQAQLEQQSGNVKGWQLLEVAYFLHLAEQKLFLEQNINGVKQVLELAEQRLKQMQDASLTPIREAIKQDQNMLAELNAADLDQLHLTLSGLRQQSLLLPLRKAERAMTPNTEDEISESSADWQANLAMYWRNFWRGLIQVRASLPEDGLSLTAEQQISVRNTLTQQLLLAELAAMQHNQAVYAAAIQQSADSLQRYFAATEPTVQQMADDLLALAALQVSLPLLAPLKSPEVFQAYQQGTLEQESGL